MGNSSKPMLMVNPADDGRFANLAHILVARGATSTDELQRSLRMVYPKAAVHLRQLSAEMIVVWYVYRDGHWIDTRPRVTAGSI